MRWYNDYDTRKTGLMSLFSLKEICDGCKLAVWHECCHERPTFCHCREDHEDETDYIRRKCKYKVSKPRDEG
jgi:hypothetical protein